MTANDRIHWAPKVNPAKIRRLYLTDAQGIVDEDLIDDVGTALFARCKSVLLVSRTQVQCPRCGTVVQLSLRHTADDPISCPAAACDWHTTYGEWHASWRYRDLIGTRALTAFAAYVAAYPQARGSCEKMMLIDQLIHAVHAGIVAGKGHRAAANNLIEGSHAQVLVLLDELAYGDGSSRGIAETRAAWSKIREDIDDARHG